MRKNDFEEKKKEYFSLVNAQGLELMEIFQYYGGCEHCEHSLCCKINIPTLLEDDIPQIASYLNMSEEKFIDKYLHEYEIKTFEDIFEKNYVINQHPCPFLNNKNKCTIYPVRPSACRWNPFQPALIKIVLEVIDICPVATLIASEVWEYQSIINKGIPENILLKYEKEFLEENKENEKRIDELLDPLDEFYTQLGIQDIGMQNYLETYPTTLFLEAMTYFDRY